ncbi:hypothetical protein AKJ16_DCAP18962 [Drosera capensis]
MKEATESTSTVEDDYSASATLVPFDHPRPLLRRPMRAGPMDNPSLGTYLLAFKDQQAFISAYKFCLSKVFEQSQSGLRIGCVKRCVKVIFLMEDEKSQGHSRAFQLNGSCSYFASQEQPSPWVLHFSSEVDSGNVTEAIICMSNFRLCSVLFLSWGELMTNAAVRLHSLSSKGRGGNSLCILLEIT